PLPPSGRQAANLDNNSGPETTDEQALTNHAVVTGTYEGAPASASGDLTRTAEDLAIVKFVDHGSIAQGDISTWSLRVRSSEYRVFGGRCDRGHAAGRPVPARCEQLRELGPAQRRVRPGGGHGAVDGVQRGHRARRRQLHDRVGRRLGS